jgi:tetratricopeptide (TPR) repeat protein
LATGSFWRLRDYNIEAMAWCQTILARAESRADLAATRIELYVVLAWSAIFAGEPKLCGAAADAGLQLVTQATDKKVIVHLYTLALMSHVLLGDYPAAERALQAGEAMAREMNYPNELAMLLVLGGQLQYFVGEDISLARANLAEAESLRIEMTSQWGSAAFIFGFARLTGLMGDVEKARERFRESEDAAGKVGNMRLVYSCHSELAHILRRHGEIDEALELYKGVLPKWKELGHRAAAAHELECIGFILMQKARPDRAVALLGAAQALRELIGSSMTPPERAEYEQALATLREQLGQEKFQQAWKFGQSMSMDQALIFALDESYA